MKKKLNKKQKLQRIKVVDKIANSFYKIFVVGILVFLIYQVYETSVLFVSGYHNSDLAFNVANLGAKYNADFVKGNISLRFDIDTWGDSYNARDYETMRVIYSNGKNFMFEATKILFILGLAIGYFLNEVLKC